MNSTAARVRWASPSVLDRNGRIRSYIISLSSLFDGTTRNDSTHCTEIDITGLAPYHSYSYRVAAFTNAIGPFSDITELKTLQDGLLTFYYT